MPIYDPTLRAGTVRTYPGYATAATVGLAPPCTTVTTAALTANRMYRVPVFVGGRRAFTSLQMQCSTLAASSHIRVGVYRCNDDGTSGALLQEGTILDTATTGVKSSTISLTLPGGTYYLQCVSDSTPSVYVCNALAGPIFGWDNSLGSVSMYLSSFRAFTYGALPSDESAQTYSVSVGSQSPFMMLR